MGSFFHTSSTGFIFMWEVSLTHPMLASFLSREFLLHIPCWLHFYLGSFSYTSRAGFILMWGISLTHPELASFLCDEFLLHIPCCPFFFFFFFFLHPTLASFLCGSFSYTSRAGFFFFFFKSGEFLLHLRTGFIFLWGVSLTHPMLFLLLLLLF